MRGKRGDQITQSYGRDESFATSYIFIYWTAGQQQENSSMIGNYDMMTEILRLDG